jgi:hypothetical protein
VDPETGEPVPIVAKAVLEECIKAAMRQYRESAKPFKLKPKKATQGATSLDEKFFSKYQKKMLTKDKTKFGHDIPVLNSQLRSHVINSFTHQLGWPDPFASDHKAQSNLDPQNILPWKVSALVYHRSRYKEGSSPTCIFLPNDTVMVSLMRACIECKKVEDAWINRPDGKEKKEKEKE